MYKIIFIWNLYIQLGYVSRSQSIIVLIPKRWLGHEGSYSSLQYETRISKQSLPKIIPEVCSAIYEEFKEEYFKVNLIILVQNKIQMCELILEEGKYNPLHIIVIEPYQKAKWDFFLITFSYLLT